MPTVKDKTTGEIISEQPYDDKGIENASAMADSNPNWEVSNAPDMREKYHMGGKIPGEAGFGMNPNQPANNMGPKPPSGGGNQPMDHEWWGGWRMRGDARPKDPDFTALMKKGGKVKK